MVEHVLKLAVPALSKAQEIIRSLIALILGRDGHAAKIKQAVGPPWNTVATNHDLTILSGL